MNRPIHIALVGNPNSGKSSLFNALTGLHQKVSNFPGVTVDKKTGSCRINDHITATIIDLPGTYSLYPKSADELVTYDLLLDPDRQDRPDIVIIIADASNLKRNLLFCTQIIDLKTPVIIALTMGDIASKKGVEIDAEGLGRKLGVPVIPINPRKNKGILNLKKAIALVAGEKYQAPAWDFVDVRALAPDTAIQIRAAVGCQSDYAALHFASSWEELSFLSDQKKKEILLILQGNKFNKTRVQAEEIMQRYARIKQIMSGTVAETDPLYKTLLTERIDSILLHRIWGYLVLLVVLFLLFQSIFNVARYPMNWIQSLFALISGSLSHLLPQGWFSDLLVNGVIAGVSGIAVFVPQIMILFGLITILEDTGYMSRISFLTDRLMRQVGLNGKSVMPLISGVACAVPAIMAARNIENRKERLITIMVTPLMSCSARLPIYTIVIAMVIPDRKVFGLFGLQGLVLMGLYLLGFVMAMLVSLVMKFFIRIKEKSYFIMELPVYRAPRWKNIGVTMVQKARIFVTDAGKVILVISVILWFLATHGPASTMNGINSRYDAQIRAHPEQALTLQTARRSDRLAHSWAGILGRGIEPVIRPLGFDWKIGIALITSFAAREVFVGTMATLYSVGGTPATNGTTLRQKMDAARNPDGSRVYTLASGLSLMLFYAFAMQCMSTLAVVRRETKTWKMPLLQFVYMTGLAYLASLFIFQLLR